MSLKEIIAMQGNASVENAKERLTLIGKATSEAVAIRAEGDAARAAEHEAGARALKAAVEATRPALPLICGRIDFSLKDSDLQGMNVTLIGSRNVKEGVRAQLFLTVEGYFLEMIWTFNTGAWELTAEGNPSIALIVALYDVEKLVAALLRAVEAQAQSKGTRLRTRQARAKARRLGAIASLIEACAPEGGGR